MSQSSKAEKHDAYASTYDGDLKQYHCYISDVLFGLLYEFIESDQSLLDAGIGSGISSQLCFKSGLEIHGMDFSSKMLDICRSKGLAKTLQQHDIQNSPWPYPAARFDHLICCGVLHFVRDLEVIFAEANRVLQKRGYFAFTTRAELHPTGRKLPFVRKVIGDFEIYTHTPEHLESLLEINHFHLLKLQKCFIGEDLFNICITQKQSSGINRSSHDCHFKER